jgi:hypothetical protein
MPGLSISASVSDLTGGLLFENDKKKLLAIG